MRMKSQLFGSLLLAVVFLNSVVASGFADNVSPSDLIGPEGFRVDMLPYLRGNVETHQFCSYDRAGDNYDWEYFPLYMNTNGECVIFDAMGPGCLYRHHMNIWHGKPIYNGIRIRYYFDNETTPRIDMDVSTFFSTNNPLGIFLKPLAHDGGNRFRMLYHPMFFKKRLKVCLSAEPGGGPTPVDVPWEGSSRKEPRGDRSHYHWYEYTYQLFAEDPGLASWTPEAGRRMMPALLNAWNTNFLARNIKSEAHNKEEKVSDKVKPGKTKTLWKSRRAGSIEALQIHVEPTNDVDALYSTWLKITFDKASAPQIEVPIGAFFGTYRTSLKSSYASLVMSYSNSTGYCYFPMPFWKSAIVEVENRGQSKVKVAATVDYKTASAMSYPQWKCGYLHASYHREDPRNEGVDYIYLKTGGSGQVVGHVVSRWDTCMEEDERTYFDGSETPWIIGEGYEDDHGMGWGLQNLTRPVFGAFDAKGGAGAVYRFLLPDMYCFSSSIQFGHQTYGPHSPKGFEGAYKIGSEESVAFWYGNSAPRLIQTDELDVGNLQSEAAHAYQAEGDVQRTNGNWWYDGEYNNVLFKTPATADDGVSFTNGCTFNVSISPDNQGVRLRRRTDKANNRQQARVYIDGQLVTERSWYSVDYEKTYRGIRWFDSDFEVPESYTKGKSRINVRIEFVGSKTGRWDEYHYWVYSHLPMGYDPAAETRL